VILFGSGVNQSKSARKGMTNPYLADIPRHPAPYSRPQWRRSVPRYRSTPACGLKAVGERVEDFSRNFITFAIGWRSPCGTASRPQPPCIFSPENGASARNPYALAGKHSDKTKMISYMNANEQWLVDHGLFERREHCQKVIERPSGRAPRIGRVPR